MMFHSGFEFGRKLLLGLAVAAGAMGAASHADAATRAIGPVPALAAPTEVQPVQYYDDWRHREWRRREAYERFRHREARREWRHAQRRHDGYGYGYGRDYGNRW